MSTNITLNDRDGHWLTLNAFILHGIAADFMLDHPQRRGAGARGYRRALVHDRGDRLTINYANDYPGGVRINSASINLRHLTNPAGLPSVAAAGDLLLVQRTSTAAVAMGQQYWTLYLCVGVSHGLGSLGGAPPALWREIPLGDTVVGSV